MDIIAFVFAIGVTSYILLKISELLDKEHDGFKVILIAFVFLNLLLVPKVIIDGKDSCEFVIDTSTVTENTTAYTYAEICSEDTSVTSGWFFKLGQLLFYLFVLYSFLYVFSKVGGTSWLKKKGLLRGV